METPELERTVSGLFNWLIWKIAHLTYLICCTLPMGLYLVCLLLITIKRESSTVLSISMMIMLHPLATIPTGFFVKVIGQYLSKTLFKDTHPQKLIFKLIKRVLTYSINCHLALIATMTYILYVLWMGFEMSSNLNFSNKPFNQCECDILSDYGHAYECTNKEAENSFQNQFLNVKLPVVIISLLVSSILCHIIQSILVQLPAPVTLLDFVLCHNKKEGEIDWPSSSQQTFSKSSKIMKFMKVSSVFLVICYVASIMTSPFYTFDLFLSGNGEFLAVSVV